MPKKTRNAKLEYDEEDTDLKASDESDEEVGQYFCSNCGEQLAPNSKFCPACGTSRARVPLSPLCCGGCCCIFLVALVVAGIVTTIFFNSWLKTSVEQIGGAVLGTAVTVDAVNLRPIEGRIHITGFDVDSPPPFKGNFLSLEEFILDVGPLSLLWGWLSSFTSPLEMEEVTLNECNVDIVVDMVPTSTSNAQTVVKHATDVTQQLTAQGVIPPLPTGETMAADTVKAMTVKLKIGKLTLSNIKVGARISNLPEVKFDLATIELTDIGKDKDGVYLYELIHILVQSLLMAILKASPESVQTFLASDLGKFLSKEGLDLGDLHFDSGHGLESIGAFSGWATAQAAMLPLRAASIGASMTEEAMKVGSKITSMENSANMAMANANLKMGEKATEEFGKLSTGFANGFASVLNHN